MVNPIDDLTRLEWPLHLDPLKSGTNVLTTIGDAATLIAKLDHAGNACGSWWTAAFACLFAAHEQPDDKLVMSAAMDALADALGQDGWLRDAAPAPERPRTSPTWLSMFARSSP
jgi:hypothetical protein